MLWGRKRGAPGKECVRVSKRDKKTGRAGFPTYPTDLKEIFKVKRK